MRPSIVNIASQPTVEKPVRGLYRSSEGNIWFFSGVNQAIKVSDPRNAHFVGDFHEFYVNICTDTTEWTRLPEGSTVTLVQD